MKDKCEHALKWHLKPHYHLFGEVSLNATRPIPEPTLDLSLLDSKFPKGFRVVSGAVSKKF